ncbi:MAG: putative leader peptide [Actinomycetes bacterium]
MLTTMVTMTCPGQELTRRRAVDLCRVATCLCRA